MRATSAELRFSGHPVAPGIGIGPVAVAAEPELVVEHRLLAADEVEAEAARLELEVSGIAARHSRVTSSTTFRMRNRRPLAN